MKKYIIVILMVVGLIMLVGVGSSLISGPKGDRKLGGNIIIHSAGKDGIHHTKDDLTLEVLTLEPERRNSSK